MRFFFYSKICTEILGFWLLLFLTQLGKNNRIKQSLLYDVAKYKTHALVYFVVEYVCDCNV